jgi:UTP--glucose-1-phosphate uridylyltransferase
MSFKIRKGVIPAAGLGTRFLPATKVLPKEMMPVAGRPLIQYAVEEAAASGVEMVVLVLSPTKNLVAGHFQRDVSLENALFRQGKTQDVEMLRALSELADVRTVCQDKPLGLADAIRTAHALIGDEPFGVILPDVLIDSPKPCLRQLMDCYAKHPGCVVGTRMVQRLDVSRFGILDVRPMLDTCCAGRTLRVLSLIERPRPELAPSLYGIFGRYILEPVIFPHIDKSLPGHGGELQLTDSLRLCSVDTPVYAYCFEGIHYDAGHKLDFLKASIEFSLKDPQIAAALRSYLTTLGSAQAEFVH